MPPPSRSARSGPRYVFVSIGPEPHPLYPPISAIGGGPPFHPNCIHVLTPFVDLSAGREAERLATADEKRAGTVPPDVLNRTPAELQRAYRTGHKHRSESHPAP